jgi:transposase
VDLLDVWGMREIRAPPTLPSGAPPGIVSRRCLRLVRLDQPLTCPGAYASQADVGFRSLPLSARRDWSVERRSCSRPRSPPRRLCRVTVWRTGLVTRRAGRRATATRVMLDAVRYVVDNGVKWASLPADFPPYRRVHAFARRWQVGCGPARRGPRPLRKRVRAKEGRAVDPTAAIVDSRPVRAAANVPRSTSGWDGGKKVAGRKPHSVVDCLGLVLAVAVTAADIGDRDAPPSRCFSGCARCMSPSAWCGRTAAMPGAWSTGRPKSSPAQVGGGENAELADAHASPGA